MGVIIKAICASCGSEWQFRTGCGILHGELGAVKALFPENIQKKLESYESEAEFPLFDFGYQMAVCEHCKSIGSVPVIKLLDREMEYAGVCENCGRQTKLIESLADTQCPVCHEYSLSEEETGLWD